MGPECNLAGMFRALGDENRLKIVRMIAEAGEVCACRLLEELEITQPTLSHHMRTLCSCGLVSCRKDGRWMHYSLDPEASGKVEAFASFLSESCADASDGRGRS